MKETKPLLMEIHDIYDHKFTRYPYTDHSQITRVRFGIADDGYIFITYPAGFGTAYDGLVISLVDKTSLGLVGLSRDFDGLIGLGNITTEEQTSETVTLTAKAVRLPNTPTTVEPGDTNFGLFHELHAFGSRLVPHLESFLHDRENGLVEFYGSTVNLIPSPQSKGF